jgi:hypothetical protein
MFWTRILGGYPGKYNPNIKACGIKSSKLFICGHSHILKVIFDKNIICAHMNQEAAWESGFLKCAPCCDLSLKVIKWDMEIIEMEKRV